jgi:hypothetical protein
VLPAQIISLTTLYGEFFDCSPWESPVAILFFQRIERVAMRLHPWDFVVGNLCSLTDSICISFVLQTHTIGMPSAEFKITEPI